MGERRYERRVGVNEFDDIGGNSLEGRGRGGVVGGERENGLMESAGEEGGRGRREELS